MSVQAYEKQMSDLSPAFDKYRMNIPNDTGIATPVSYTVGPNPGPPYILNAIAGQSGSASLSTNPAADLYSSGQQNLVLLSATSNSCSAGCLPIEKPDPRVFQVKPLYMPSVFSGKNFPTSYNVTGMY
jgi:hypothetical protein